MKYLSLLFVLLALPVLAVEKEFSWTKVTEAADNTVLPESGVGSVEAYVLRCADTQADATANRWKTRNEFLGPVYTAKVDLAEQAWTCAMFAWTQAGFSVASNLVSFNLAAPAPTPPATPKVPKAPVLSVK